MSDDSFKEFVLDQLSALPELRARAMFGAHGLYSDGRFFAILDEGRLFFKTDAQSQVDYTTRGMGPFTYEMKGRVLSMGYHEVPPEVLENRTELAVWAGRAIQIAGAKKSVRKRRWDLQSRLHRSSDFSFDVSCVGGRQALPVQR